MTLHLRYCDLIVFDLLNALSQDTWTNDNINRLQVPANAAKLLHAADYKLRILAIPSGNTENTNSMQREELTAELQATEY